MVEKKEINFLVEFFVLFTRPHLRTDSITMDTRIRVPRVWILALGGYFIISLKFWAITDDIYKSKAQKSQIQHTTQPEKVTTLRNSLSQTEFRINHALTANPDIKRKDIEFTANLESELKSSSFQYTQLKSEIFCESLYKQKILNNHTFNGNFSNFHQEFEIPDNLSGKKYVTPVDGCWKPGNCEVQQTVAVIVAYRDRENHLNDFLDYRAFGNFGPGPKFGQFRKIDFWPKILLQKSQK